MRRLLTDSYLKGLTPTDGKRVEVFDTAVRPFGFRLGPRGARFFVLYRSGGRVVRYGLGAYPAVTLADARDEARRVLVAVANGEDPAASRLADTTAISWEALTEQYLTRYARERKRTWREDERVLGKETRAWAKRHARDITRADVLLLHERVTKRGPTMANRTLEIVSKAFAWARTAGYVEDNPCALVEPNSEKKRKRVLTEDELRAVWHALDHEPAQDGGIFRVLLWTAARRGEVLGMQWSEIDFDDAVWTIPSARAKNGRSRRVPLSDDALLCLSRLRRDASGEHVWPSSRTSRHRASVRKALARIQNRTAVREWTVHDLRRTVATFLGELSVDEIVIGEVLGHVRGGITATYNRHPYDAEKRAALARWAARLREIADDTATPQPRDVGDTTARMLH